MKEAEVLMGYSNFCIIGIPEGEEREKETES